MSTRLSAICVSHASRFGFLQRAILDFFRQTQEGLELVIVVNQEGYYDRIASFLDNGPQLAVVLGGRFNPAQVHLQLASFRDPCEGFRVACQYAAGEYLACWDDDNLSHPTRLERQLALTEGTGATVLGASLCSFYDSDELFVVDYTQPSGGLADRCAWASLVADRRKLPPLDGNGRETWSRQMLTQLARARNYRVLPDLPELFMVGAGDNFTGSAAMRHLTELPGTFTRQELLDNAVELEKALDGYILGKDKLDLCGRDAQAGQVEHKLLWPSGLAPCVAPSDWQQRVPGRDFQEHQALARKEQREGQK